MNAGLGYSVMNVEKTLTFRRPGRERTNPDIAIESEPMRQDLVDWKVTDDCTSSNQ